MMCCPCFIRGDNIMIYETEKEIQQHFSSELRNDDEYEKEFKSLKGIAGRKLDIDDIRKERLKL